SQRGDGQGEEVDNDDEEVEVVGRVGKSSSSSSSSSSSDSSSPASTNEKSALEAKFLPQSGDSTLVSSSRDGQVRVSNLTCPAKGGVVTRRLAQHRGAAHKLSLEDSSPCVFLSAGEDAVVFSFDLRSDTPASKLLVCRESLEKVPLYSVTSRPLSPHHFALGGKDPFVRLFDRRKINESVNNGVLHKYSPQHLVNREIVSGLRYIQNTHRKGVKVDKANYMVGSYGPRVSEHEFVTPPEEAPRGLLARGTYSLRSQFTDDDKTDHLSWEWNLKIHKEWKD
ncbi:unnamed protein product, partial [Lampetra fluviatilis]